MGLWAPEEYEKLSTYDDRLDVNMAVFHCHQETVTKRPTVCRGWLGVHVDHPAVRLAVLRGDLDYDDLPTDEEVDPSLYATGIEACDAGRAGVEAPSPEAAEAIQKLLLRRGLRVE